MQISKKGGENMKLLSIWNMELLTIGTLVIFVVLMELKALSWREKGSDTEVKIWRLKARSVQEAEGIVGALMKYKQLTSEVLLGKDRSEWTLASAFRYVQYSSFHEPEN